MKRALGMEDGYGYTRICMYSKMVKVMLCYMYFTTKKRCVYVGRKILAVNVGNHVGCSDAPAD